ncbi:uncharacterized protein LOC143031265 isoform X2 [Oratosquilla oratoria]|uniref:uncharacterized protein LOC143031265 isoform X2 n=1 Tax=Oratosquilla oratoria TaxID=337810 RepID=UPI003F766CFC
MNVRVKSVVDEPHENTTMEDSVKKSKTKMEDITIKKEFIDEVFCEPGLISFPERTSENYRVAPEIEDSMKTVNMEGPLQGSATVIKEEVTFKKEMTEENEVFSEPGLINLQPETIQVKFEGKALDEMKTETKDKLRTSCQTSAIQDSLEYTGGHDIDGVGPPIICTDLARHQSRAEAKTIKDSSQSECHHLRRGDSEYSKGPMSFRDNKTGKIDQGETFGKTVNVTKNYIQAEHNVTPVVKESSDQLVQPRDRKVHTSEKPHECKECGQRFTRLGNLKTHTRVHTGERPYECNECGQQFKEQGKLKMHIRIHTGERPHECKHCGQRFTQLGGLKRHIRIHTDDRPYNCKECDRRFADLGSLKKHIRVHTGERPYECKECGHRFTEGGSLKKHARIHTGEKPYQCKECGQRFTVLGSLQIHARLHTGEKPYECKDCGQRFTDCGRLKKHSRVHTDDRPHKCKECGLQFKELGSLKRHTRIHTGEKPYECKECEQKFAQLGSLKRHARVHTGEKPFECEVCGQKFTQQGNLKCHKNIHTQVNDNAVLGDIRKDS